MYKEKVKILDREIKRGENVTLELDIAKLHTRNTLQIPIIINRAKEDGPVILFIAGIHGDELNGVEIVRRIIHSKLNKCIKGTVICIPVFNVFGFLNISREFPDGRDLNRMFPGSAKGSLASQFAYQFMKGIAPAVDYVIDFHTGGADRVNAPQTRCDLNDEASFNLAKVFGTQFIVHSKHLAKTVRQSLSLLGKTALLFEGGKAKHLDENVIQSGVNGAINILNHFNMRRLNDVQHEESIIVKKSKWIRAPYSGMFQSKIKNGQWIEAKTVMGIITDPYGDFERKIKAPFDCYVFCSNITPIVNRGDALYHVSVETA